MPCPGCQATLRVPAGAAAIRCPACKTVIPLAAPAGAAAPAIPLPFGGPPAVPPPPPPPPVARAGPPVRAAEYRDDDPESDETRPRKDASKRNSLLDFDDDELTDDERKEKRRLERLVVECKPAQTGVTVLAYAYGADAVGYLMGFLYLVVAAFGAPIVPIAWLAIGLHVLALGGQLLGLGFCCGGPRANRSVAYFGLGTTVLAFLTLGFAFIYSLVGHAVIVSGAGLFEGGKVGHGDMALWVLAPLAPTLELLSFPVWIADGSFRGGAWLIIIPGLFDLARHTYAAVLVRSYCEDGKSPELGWTVSRFMTRIYAAFGTFFVSRLIACGLIVGNAATRDDSGLLIFLSLTYAGAIAALAMAMVAQAYVLTDAAEVIDYKRFALKGGRLDSV
jgi:LSD1 subclass zinc finger protein